jgi:hypothetical protein
VAQQTVGVLSGAACQVWRSVLLMLHRAGLPLEETRRRTASFIPCGISEQLDRGALACKSELPEILFVALEMPLLETPAFGTDSNGSPGTALLALPPVFDSNASCSATGRRNNKGSQGCLYFYRRYEQISASGAVSGSPPAGQSPQPVPLARSRNRSSIRD